MTLQFGHIELFVKDPRASANFYQEVLGFQLETVQRDKYFWLHSGDATILLRPGSIESPAPNYQRAPSGFVLYCDDVTATAEDLKSRGLKFLGTDGADTCLTFTDPDGNWFQLVNPAKA